MKPINSKERSKLFWQFVTVFIALAVLPVVMVFFSYYQVGQKMEDEDQQNLLEYANYKNHQKTLIKQLNDLDSNINNLTNGTVMANGDIQVAEVNIAKAISNLSTDSLALVRTIGKTYGHYFSNAQDYLKCKNDLKAASTESKSAKDALKGCMDDKKHLQDMIDLKRN